VAFRGSGPDDETSARNLDADVKKYRISAVEAPDWTPLTTPWASWGRVCRPSARRATRPRAGDERVGGAHRRTGASVITGKHVIVYSADAQSDRAFLLDLLGTDQTGR
jgi:hypothetical protein